ncbi:Na+/H+ antiporter subunit E [Streptomyces sp. S07_1.15]|uniref:Na+/H+ antiporter subunit E n=1 Tax=Streptomyces sp. S07_1.15 TaxID=2873925 RepID=UPI001D150C69|nr:Na+/H+ antiporter subunit E [Streptomyces sp. S07_1.15]MCC3655603.1 Na+/H+ antiporter subunit E [Streptomyces sp. S07_1.15]
MTVPRFLYRTRDHLPLFCWLLALWTVLWGSPRPAVLLSGVPLAAAVVRGFALPPLLPRVAVRPWRLVLLLGFMLADLLQSGITVAWQALRHGPRARAAVVEVPLRADTDLLIAATATLTTLTPGTLVLEIDRDRRLLYVHALPAGSPRQAERRRHEVLRAEHHVTWALARAGAAGRDQGPRPAEGTT